jgi:hypothetical protein
VCASFVIRDKPAIVISAHTSNRCMAVRVRVLANSAGRSARCGSGESSRVRHCASVPIDSRRPTKGGISDKRHSSSHDCDVSATANKEGGNPETDLISKPVFARVGVRVIQRDTARQKETELICIDFTIAHSHLTPRVSLINNYLWTDLDTK